MVMVCKSCGNHEKQTVVSGRHAAAKLQSCEKAGQYLRDSLTAFSSQEYLSQTRQKLSAEISTITSLKGQCLCRQTVLAVHMPISSCIQECVQKLL